MEILPRFIIEDDDTGLLGRFTAWMVDVVDHAATDYRRRQAHQNKEMLLDDYYQNSLYYEDLSPAIHDGFDFEQEKLSAAFSKLTLLRRQILTLIFVEGMAALEVAEKLGCSVDYVYLQKHRTLKKLRDQLMEGGDGHGE